ncbi:hypothetical protein HMPREF1267_00393 [Corynebacterium sp. KPL1824]|nr:hypothetical protein HMPREF1267_00393 [Corynebacterium sp. KPL1824]
MREKARTYAEAAKSEIRTETTSANVSSRVEPIMELTMVPASSAIERGTYVSMNCAVSASTSPRREEKTSVAMEYAARTVGAKAMRVR